jgi:ribosomal protein L7/L12
MDLIEEIEMVMIEEEAVNKSTVEFNFKVNPTTNKKIAIIASLRGATGLGLKETKDLVEAAMFHEKSFRMNILQFGIFMAQLHQREGISEVIIDGLKISKGLKDTYDFSRR